MVLAYPTRLQIPRGPYLFITNGKNFTSFNFFNQSFFCQNYVIVGTIKYKNVQVKTWKGTQYGAWHDGCL